METAWMVALVLVVSGPLIGFFGAHAWAEAQGLRLRTTAKARNQVA